MPNFTIKHTNRVLLHVRTDELIAPGAVLTMPQVDNSSNRDTMFLLSVKVSSPGDDPNNFLDIYLVSSGLGSQRVESSVPLASMRFEDNFADSRDIHFTYGIGHFNIKFVNNRNFNITLSYNLYSYNPHSLQDP